MTTKIEWTDVTWNPVRGCSRVSEGCRNCYAEKMAARFSDAGMPYEGLATRNPARWTGEVRLVEEHLTDPLKWTKPRRVFVNSMSDLFHEKLSDADIDRVFAVMALAPRHTFQLLTKRPKRMREYLERNSTGGHILHVASQMGAPQSGRWPLPNVHLGVSVEDQRAADERIPLLLQTPAAVRFISAEPLLGSVDLRAVKWWPGSAHRVDVLRFGFWRDPARIGTSGFVNHSDMHDMFGQPIQWVIVGGESGPGARSMNVEWALSIIEQCKAAAVPVFMKQLGARPYDNRSDEPEAPPYEFFLSDRKGGDMEEWPEEFRVRQFPDTHTAATGRGA